MRTELFAILVFLAGGYLAGAQNVQVQTDPSVEQLVRNWTAQNRANPRMEGWRIQILSSTDRQRVEAGKVQFLSLHPEFSADWVHEKPYYKLRAGAFLTKQEALSALILLKDTYPDAYPTRDNNIHPRDFLN